MFPVGWAAPCEIHRTPMEDVVGNVRWVPTEAGAHLRGRVNRNTRPEVALRAALHRLGLRFRLHRVIAGKYTVDIVLPKWRVAVFVDGCFWHGCPRHSPDEFKGPNAERWQRKIAENRERDARSTAAARSEGWHVIRVWECDVRRDVNAAAKRVEETAHKGI
jgi:DNA mismatch endonuclease (patch repair protein)